MKTMKKMLVLILSMIMVLSVLGCSKPQEDNTVQDQKEGNDVKKTEKSETSETSEQKKLDKVTVILPRTPEVLDDVDFIVADEVGIFEKYGIEFNIEVASGTSDMQMVAMDRGQICFPDPIVMMLGKDSGLDMISFFQRDTIAMNVLVVRTDSDIYTLEDIAGKSIAIGDAAWSVGIDPVLKAAGVDISTIEYVVAGEDRAQMLMSGKVDAAFSWEKGYQLWEASGMEFRVLPFYDYVDMVGNPLATTVENVKNNPDLYQRFAKAMAEAEYWVTCNPEAATQIVLNRFPSIDIELEDGVEIIKAAIMVWTGSPYFDEYGFGYVDDQVWLNTYQYAKDVGVITGDYKIEDLYTNQFIKEANNFDREAVKAAAEAYVVEPKK